MRNRNTYFGSSNLLNLDFSTHGQFVTVDSKLKNSTHMNRTSSDSSYLAMNPQASSFSPSSTARQPWMTPPRSSSCHAEQEQYSPSNPYRHTAKSAFAASPGSPIVITPKIFSPQDIYEYQRSPSGNVVVTAGGQKVEFWERVHIGSPRTALQHAGSSNLGSSPPTNNNQQGQTQGHRNRQSNGNNRRRYRRHR
jgi:hypothetical protein